MLKIKSEEVLMITIKPHHFLDIIKLYGKGIERFVKDEAYNHDFYSVANEIINNNQVIIKLTLFEDDICGPCKYMGNDGVCTDKIYHISSINSKDKWNKILDQRIMNYTDILENSTLSARDFCEILYSKKEYIFDIWKEDDDSANKSRYDAFCDGAIKYLEK